MPKIPKPYPQKAREWIKAGKIMTKLNNHILGEEKMTSTQITAAKILLAKVVPDLKQSEVKVDANTTTYVIGAQPELSVEEWQAQQSSGNPSQGRKPH